MDCDVGLDWGGLRREWFEMLCSELFDATGCGLFIQFNTDTQALVGSSDDYVSNSRSIKTHPKWTRSDRRGSSATRSDRRGSSATRSDRRGCSATRSIWTRSCQMRINVKHNCFDDLLTIIGAEAIIGYSRCVSRYTRMRGGMLS